MYDFFAQNFNLVIGLLLAAVLGAAGLNLLLPHRHGQMKPRQSYVVGGVLALLALGLFATQLVGPPLLINQVFFYVFAILSAIAGTLMITSRDPINSALWFAVVVLCSSGLFLLAGAQFLAAGTVIVYAGAIIVTFLFVIMLAQSHGRAAYDRMARTPLVASLTSVALLAGVAACILHARDGAATEADQSVARSLPPSFAPMTGANARETADLATVVGRAIPPTTVIPVLDAEGNAIDPTGERRDLTDAKGRPTSHVGGLGATLFIDHFITVQVIGVILFVALIGAVSYATHRLRPATTAIPERPLA